MGWIKTNFFNISFIGHKFMLFGKGKLLLTFFYNVSITSDSNKTFFSLMMQIAYNYAREIFDENWGETAWKSRIVSHFVRVYHKAHKKCHLFKRVTWQFFLSISHQGNFSCNRELKLSKICNWIRNKFVIDGKSTMVSIPNVIN